MLLPFLAEDQGFLVEEKVPLHRLEAGQVLHLRGALPVAHPHAEGALHQDFAKLTQVPLEGRGKGYVRPRIGKAGLAYVCRKQALSPMR